MAGRATHHRAVQHFAQFPVSGDALSCNMLHVAAHETNRAKVVSRLQAEGWVNLGGKSHDKFTKSGVPPIIVPRHRILSPGVARSIAKAASWT